MAAFSLIELMFALGLAATIAGIAIPQTLASLEESRAVASARYMSVLLQRTRMDAITRSSACALQVVRSGDTFSYAVYVDGNRNGVLSTDIQAGRDQMIRQTERLADRFSGIEFGTIPALPAVDPSGTPPGTDPIRLGSGDMATFTPTGTATSGSLYLRGPHTSTQFVVRIFGETGRTRIFKFDPRTWQWIPLQNV